MLMKIKIDLREIHESVRFDSENTVRMDRLLTTTLQSKVPSKKSRHMFDSV